MNIGSEYYYHSDEGYPSTPSSPSTNASVRGDNIMIGWAEDPLLSVSPSLISETTCNSYYAAEQAVLPPPSLEPAPFPNMVSYNPYICGTICRS